MGLVPTDGEGSTITSLEAGPDQIEMAEHFGLIHVAPSAPLSR